MSETNDMILTKQRQEEIKKNGVPKGFPIFIIRNRWNSILGVFASKKNAEEKLNEGSLSYFVNPSNKITIILPIENSDSTSGNELMFIIN